MHSHKNVIELFYSILSKKTGRNVLSFLPFKACLFIGLCLCVSCKQNEQDLSKLVEYTGPKMVSENIERLISDRAIIRGRLTASLEEQMQNEDLVYPKGVFIEFYDENQVKTSTLSANKARYDNTKRLYTVTDNVVIIDSVKSQKMNTEELHWDPSKQIIYTDKFVTIQTKKEVLKGQGLEAKEDFSSWRILSPKGTLPINQQ
ncbi:LPS export ABC transporter periplasmic protein LptC [Rhodocytophaga aerolata]|uniref:LPS export ABC transporter periplasmic protein LptC n=1 Tax=Rhodocytophaga aerolata TaxID=455078 RepID=A0ABT8R861_9BACT|nr:LPS export ABC transporter periplasmic protein LptC [Rhodocytophaga aerolata]MDO1448282.1 LPS export ABC transporter periplasmic protein LptC [Rhodocytophaga aerolata]